MKYKKYLMMFLAGTMALTPAAPMTALAEDADLTMESEAAEENEESEEAEEAEVEEAEAEEAEEAEVEEAEVEEAKETENEEEMTEEAAEIAEGEAVAEPMLLLGTTAIAAEEPESDGALQAGTYSVAYEMQDEKGEPSDFGGVQDGNMIVHVSENGEYTYYMTVKNAMYQGWVDFWLTKVALEDGTEAEVIANTTVTVRDAQQEIPQVFKLDGMDKKDSLQIQMSTNVGNSKPYTAALVMDWDNATSGATIPEQKAEENPELAVGVYSVEYGIMNASNPTNPSMAGGVQDGNMIVDVSEENGQKAYTYYMTVKEMDMYGIKAHMVELKLGDENGEAAEVYATTTLNEESVPQVFRFARTEKEELLNITLVSSFMTAPAVLSMKWDTATTEGATIPEGDTKPEPPASTIPAPIIQAEKETAENGSIVAVTLAMDSQYQTAEIYYTTDGTAPTTDSESYTAPIQVTGASETKTIKAIAVLDGKASAVSEKSITFQKSSTSGKTDEIADGKYWMEVQLYNAEKDAVSMGDLAFENNRRALVTVKGGTATIEIATNPIYRDSIVSGIGKIESTDKDVVLTVLDTNTNTEYSFEYVESFQIELSDLTKKFVNVKFTVPNAPMESMYPDGVPARLMLDFGGMTKASDSASLKPNGKTASKSGSDGAAFDAEDQETGVKLAAGKFVFEDGVALQAAKLTEAKEKETAEKLLHQQADRMDLYEIKVLNGKTEVTPSGTVKISIPVRKGETVAKLYRITPADKKKDAAATELEFTRSKDGSYLELEVKELGQFAVVYAEAGEAAEEETEAPMEEESRTDISGHWAEDMIAQAMQKGFMTGIGNGDFAPEATVTRGMLITALGRMEGIKKGMYQGGGFADVKDEDYFAPFVAWAVTEKLAGGISEAEFAPQRELTREQLAVFVYHYAQKKGIVLTGESKTFSDADAISDWAKDAVAALTGAGILNGRPDGTFDAKGKATRAETATVLVKLAAMAAEK